MAAPVPREASNDLWARAVAQLPIEDKCNIDINCSDKLGILVHLYAEVEKSKQRSIKSRWKYTRKNGQTLILRDVFDRIARWIDMFKQVGDVAVQYDPAHASLPWAAIRLVLQIAVNDSKKLATVMESLALIAELICRHAVTEALYLKGTSVAARELERALVKLYASILCHLSKAKQYLEQTLTKRIIKSVLITEDQLDSGLGNIHIVEADISLCMSLVDRNDTVQCHTQLKDLLARIDTPSRPMNDELKNVHDNLETSRRTQIVRWLSPEPFKEHHNQARQGVLAGTGQWLLSHSVFKQWKNDSASSILWLHGIVGSGKSKLVSIVIDEAMQSFKAGNTPQPVFFYCSRNPSEPTRSDPGAILASLARQLSCLEPGKPLLRPLLDLYNEKEEEGFASGSIQMEESRALILQLIEQYPLTTIIIDAMDECDPSKRRELLKILEDILRDSSSLVKIFVSSRNDVDIVLRLQQYPNLEIDCRRNSDDITRFVENETERLIQNGDLLQYSSSQARMKELVVKRVIAGAAGMFRWASMQLQYICSFDMDSDIESSLGRLPPDLHSLYTEIYEMLTTKPGKAKAMIFKNALCWLLCAKRTLNLDEFLSAVSINPQSGTYDTLISKDLVLKICNNFIVFDSQLNMFRFAHLSVREFLEQRGGYDELTTNALAAEFCLWTVLSADPNAATQKLLLELGWQTPITRIQPKELRVYADIYWAVHSKSAGEKRKLGKLKMALVRILLHDGEASCPIEQWSNRLQIHSADHRLRQPEMITLQDTVPAAAFPSSAGLFVSCVFDFEEQIGATLGNQALELKCVNQMRRSPLHVAVRHGSCRSLARLLDQDRKNIEITHDIVIEAAKSTCNGKVLVSLLLDCQGADIRITEDVVKVAAANNYSGKDVMTLILDRQGADVQITEAVVQAAARNWRSGKDVMALLLDRRGADVHITEKVLEATARNFYSGIGIMTLLLDRRGEDVRITKEVVKAVAGDGEHDTMTLLLDRRGADIQITEEVLIAAAGNLHNGKDIITLFLDRRGLDVQITEEVVKAAARNWRSGKDVMALLLDRRGADVHITEEVVKAAARNWRSGKDVMALLLDRRGGDVRIIKEVVKEVAGNGEHDTMALLLDRRGADVQITEEVVKAAAGNLASGKDMMILLLYRRGKDVRITTEVLTAAAGDGKHETVALLLDRQGADIQITEEVLRAAAGNQYSGKDTMTLFLGRRGADVHITEEVVKAAARNWRSGKDVMALLLDRRGEDVRITKEVVKAVAGVGKHDTVTLLLDRRGADIQITEEVLIAAAGNLYSGKDIMTLFLDRRGADVQITEEVVKAAARNWRSGKDVMTLLLDRRGEDVRITKEVVKAVARNGEHDTMALLLDRRGADVQITEEVVKAAARNWNSGKDVMAFFLDRPGADVQITEEVVKAAAGNRNYGKAMMILFRQITDLEITDEVIEAAANSGNKDVLCLLDNWSSIGFEKVKWFSVAQLYNAAESGDVTTIRRLVEEGVPLDSQNIYGVTPLWRASAGGHTEVVRLLLATNAVNVNVRSTAGRSPIFWPSANGYYEVVRLLLEHGAQQDYTDQDGETPLSIAQSSGQSKIVEILLQDSVKVSVGGGKCLGSSTLANS